MRTLIFSLFAIPLFGFAFIYNSIDVNNDDQLEMKTKYAHADITSNGTSGVSGYVEFRKVAGGVHVTGMITGLTPGQHGMHIHEKGVCDAPSFESAGGHFNPMNMTHGGPDSDNRHAGDYGNLTADANGNASIDYIDKETSLSGKYNIIGRAIVIHEKADDLKTDPSGSSGSRIACGVIMSGRSTQK